MSRAASVASGRRAEAARRRRAEEGGRVLFPASADLTAERIIFFESAEYHFERTEPRFIDGERPGTGSVGSDSGELISRSWVSRIRFRRSRFPHGETRRERRGAGDTWRARGDWKPRKDDVTLADESVRVKL